MYEPPQESAEPNRHIHIPACSIRELHARQTEGRAVDRSAEQTHTRTDASFIPFQTLGCSDTLANYIVSLLIIVLKLQLSHNGELMTMYVCNHLWALSSWVSGESGNSEFTLGMRKTNMWF